MQLKGSVDPSWDSRPVFLDEFGEARVHPSLALIIPEVGPFKLICFIHPVHSTIHLLFAFGQCLTKPSAARPQCKLPSSQMSNILIVIHTDLLHVKWNYRCSVEYSVFISLDLNINGLIIILILC